jgi:hypothetical protein
VTTPLSPQVGDRSFCHNCHGELYYGPFPADQRLPAGLMYRYLDAEVWRHQDGWVACPSRGGQIAAPGAPEIVCLCGSSRFYDQFLLTSYHLGMSGCIAVMPAFYAHLTSVCAEKVTIGELHKRKIDLANRVLVLNVGGYIGESTRSEIDYAEGRGIRVDYLEQLL